MAGHAWRCLGTWSAAACLWHPCGRSSSSKLSWIAPAWPLYRSECLMHHLSLTCLLSPAAVTCCCRYVQSLAEFQAILDAQDKQAVPIKQVSTTSACGCGTCSTMLAGA